MKRFIRIYVSVVVGVALAALIAFLQVRATTEPAYQPGVAGTPIGGSLAGLTDHNGQTVTDETFAGKAQLVFFGFTHCPSICPTELQKMTMVLKDLTPDEKSRIAPIFISVDPARDTVPVMKDYLAMFDPAITGLTGTEGQIDAIKGDWKVFSARVKSPEMTEYTVDHSAFTYFRAADGALIQLFSGTDPVDAYTKAVKAHLAAQ